MQRLARMRGNGPGPLVFLALLLSIDAVLIGLHLLRGFVGEPSGFAFDLGVERGYGEFLQYTKGLWACGLLLVLAVLGRAPLLGAWAGILGAYVLDDAFMVHESVGARIAPLLTLPESLARYATHVGELAYLGAMGVVAVSVLALLHRRSALGPRSLSRRIFWCAGLLVALGIGVDALHAIPLELAPHGPADVLMTAVEDGGELMVLSLLVAVLFASMEARLSASGRTTETHAAEPVTGEPTSEEQGPQAPPRQKTGDSVRWAA